MLYFSPFGHDSYGFPMTLYPLKFRPILVPKPWGGRKIARYCSAAAAFQRENPNTALGESWVVSDLPDASVIVTNGPLAGATLHEVIARYGSGILGTLSLDDHGAFPLLVKYLDAAENLSVQVHPDSAYCRAHPSARLKSEAWYILEADPGAVIYKGIKPGVSPAQFRDDIGSGRVVSDLVALPVKAGECHYLPSGTCHALGAGVMVLEVQTPSDTTFRVYDWGRTDRTLHIEEALQCIQFGPPDTRRAERRSHVAGFFVTASRLCTCRHFQIEKVRMVAEYSQEIAYDRPAIWVILSGKGRISGSPAGIDVSLSPGEVALVPPRMPDARVEIEEDMVWLDIQFPRVDADLMA